MNDPKVRLGVFKEIEQFVVVAEYTLAGQALSLDVLAWLNHERMSNPYTLHLQKTKKY